MRGRSGGGSISSRIITNGLFRVRSKIRRPGSRGRRSLSRIGVGCW